MVFGERLLEGIYCDYGKMPFKVVSPPSLSVQVRSVCGSTYMLTHDEELWEKHLPPAVEDLLSQAKDPLADRSDRSEGRRGRG